MHNIGLDAVWWKGKPELFIATGLMSSHHAPTIAHEHESGMIALGRFTQALFKFFFFGYGA
jgi:hypothetical protein